MKKKKARVTITPTQKWAIHVSEMIVLYGDIYVDWYKEEGCKLFFEYAEKNGIKFIESV